MIHPVEWLAERIGRLSTLAVLGVIVVATVELTPTESRIATIVLAGGVIAVLSSRKYLDGGEGRTELDVATDQYVEGVISLDEFERRSELILDDRATEIRESVEQVSGVGPATSASIAQAYERIEDVEVASVDNLTEVHGVGPSTAEAIHSRFNNVSGRRSRSSTSTSTATDGGEDG
jgi:ERCC4-type nuclease